MRNIEVEFVGRVNPETGIWGNCQVGYNNNPEAEAFRWFEYETTALCIYNNEVFQINWRGSYHPSREELALLVEHCAVSRHQEFARMRLEVEAFRNFERVQRMHPADREPIPRAVRQSVWPRDGGKCVQCGSRENLEFDHIIPRSQGGSSTERNVQLLCESCNRSKWKQI